MGQVNNINGTKIQYVIKITFLRLGLKQNTFILTRYHDFG